MNEIAYKYIAHSKNNNGEEQSMKQHSEGVVELMKSFALSEDFVSIYSFLGLMHDIGKYSEGFQNYIRHGGGKVSHARWGAYFAQKSKLINIAFPIIGHHTGLPNRDAMFETFSECEKDPEIMKAIQMAMEDDEFNIPDCHNAPFNTINGITQKELFVRMLFSSLVDADSLDTERHFTKEQYESRSCKSLEVDELLSALKRKFDSFTQDSPLNKLRTEVRIYAQSLACVPQGCFSMTLPTGMGKTLCSLNWALYHAKAHPNIKRIVIVLPFTSIIDQTARELKNIFGDKDVVLEHHSNIIYENDNDEDYYCKNPKQLATENWNYPIVVTTAVQFFESIFSNQRTKCRKVHNLQDSIVIFDEIQTLPVDLAECTMRMLNDMLYLCRCSILFCTATQPNFHTRKDFSGIDHITPLVEDPASIFAATERVKYHSVANYEAQSIDSIADVVTDEENSVLIVCNTKKKALALFEKIRARSKIQVMHLSNNMCQVHRMKVINEVKQKLKDGEKLILCSTQLIEAGVDIDFPVVYREFAPLESIIQSAGRCNREGKLQRGKVYLFQLKDQGQPSKQYESFAQYAQLCYQGNEGRLLNADFYTEYYTEIIKLFAPQDAITPEREHLMFQNVADMYHIINSNTTSLFIYRYDRKSLNLYNIIKDKEYLNRNDYQQISQYIVQVSMKFENWNEKNIITLDNGLKIWSGAYSEKYGLSNEDELYYI